MVDRSRIQGFGSDDCHQTQSHMPGPSFWTANRIQGFGSDGCHPQNQQSSFWTAMENSFGVGAASALSAVFDTAAQHVESLSSDLEEFVSDVATDMNGFGSAIGSVTSINCAAPAKTRFEELSFDKPDAPVGGSNRFAQKLDLIQKQDDMPGQYEILFHGTRVSSCMNVADQGDTVAFLTSGAVVNVVEVTFLADEQRIRGRLHDPPGWISLFNMQTKKRWAKRRSSQEDDQPSSRQHAIVKQQQAEFATINYPAAELVKPSSSANVSDTEDTTEPRIQNDSVGLPDLMDLRGEEIFSVIDSTPPDDATFQNLQMPEVSLDPFDVQARLAQGNCSPNESAALINY